MERSKPRRSDVITTMMIMIVCHRFCTTSCKQKCAQCFKIVYCNYAPNQLITKLPMWMCTLICCDRCCRPNATVPKSLFNSVLYSQLGAKREENSMRSANIWMYVGCYCYCWNWHSTKQWDARWDPERFLFVYTHLRRTLYFVSTYDCSLWRNESNERMRQQHTAYACDGKSNAQIL